MTMSNKREKHLESLGLNAEKDDEEEIKRAYKKMALKYHPDKNPGDKTATKRFQEINEAYRFLSDGAEESDSDSDCCDAEFSYRFRSGGRFDSDDDDLLLFYILSQMFGRRGGGPFSYAFTSGGRRSGPSRPRKPPPPRKRSPSPSFSASPPPTYQETEKEKQKREKRQAKKRRQRERKANEKTNEEEKKKDESEKKSNAYSEDITQDSETSREATPEVPEDYDEAKLFYEYLADKHGFQSRGETPEGESADRDAQSTGRKISEKTKTYEEWKADRNKTTKSKKEIQQEQKRRDEEAKSIGEELKRKAKIKEEKEKKQKEKQKLKEEKEKREREEREKREKELSEQREIERKKIEEEKAKKRELLKQNKRDKNENKAGKKKVNASVSPQKVEECNDWDSDESEESEEESDHTSVTTAETKTDKIKKPEPEEFVTNTKKGVKRELTNTTKKLPDFMMRETDPIKRMKYKTEICKVYQQTGVCPKRDLCVYAHGKHEMRMKPKCQLCFKWQAGYCPFMEDPSQCVFAHGEEEYKPEFASIYLTLHPDVANKAPPNPITTPFTAPPQPPKNNNNIGTNRNVEPNSGICLGPRDPDGGYVTIQPASEMEEMEMLRRAIEMSMLEEKSRKTEESLINKPVPFQEEVKPVKEHIKVPVEPATAILGLPTSSSSSSHSFSNDTRKETLIRNAGLRLINEREFKGSSTLNSEISFVGGDQHNLLSDIRLPEKETAEDFRDTPILGGTIIGQGYRGANQPSLALESSDISRQTPMKNSFALNTPVTSESNQAPIGTPKPTGMGTMTVPSKENGLGTAVMGSPRNSDALIRDPRLSLSPNFTGFPKRENSSGHDTLQLGESSLFPSFHAESPVTGLPGLGPHHTASSIAATPTLSELQKNSEPLHASPVRQPNPMPPIGTPPTSNKATTTCTKSVGMPLTSLGASRTPTPKMDVSNTKIIGTRLPAGLGTIRATPLSTEAESKPMTNGGLYGSDTAVIMPGFQNSISFDANETFQSDEEFDEFISDDELESRHYTQNISPQKKKNNTSSPIIENQASATKTTIEQQTPKETVSKATTKPGNGMSSAPGPKRPFSLSQKLCKHGSLCWSQHCPFRHPEREGCGRSITPSDDSKTLPPYKTKECWNWIKKGFCPYKDSCHFAHGQEELRGFEINKMNGHVESQQ